MNDRYQFYAYLATLVALLVVVIAGLVAVCIAPATGGRLEVFGFGTITGGLIGILKLPQSSQRTAANVGTADSVTVTPPALEK